MKHLIFLSERVLSKKPVSRNWTTIKIKHQDVAEVLKDPAIDVLSPVRLKKYAKETAPA